ncbi:MAG: hypothetical protein E6G39_17815 [Actinobacteria bacterium]|nr:MAG: hypothetical protein E6G39_17815 [Actinomycetota bacterium]
MALRIRPAGSGGEASCAAFLRATTSPRAALVFCADVPAPSDWPTTTGISTADAQLSHVVGWVCEVRGDNVVLLNPLGEGLFRAPLPPLSEAWLREVRATASTAVYLLGSDLSGETPEGAIDQAALRGRVPAASVRTAITDAYGKSKPVGRNDPCPCGSGRKYKQCHLK